MTDTERFFKVSITEFLNTIGIPFKTMQRKHAVLSWRLTWFNISVKKTFQTNVCTKIHTCVTLFWNLHMRFLLTNVSSISRCRECFVGVELHEITIKALMMNNWNMTSYTTWKTRVTFSSTRISDWHERTHDWVLLGYSIQSSWQTQVWNLFLWTEDSRNPFVGYFDEEMNIVKKST